MTGVLEIDAGVLTGVWNSTLPRFDSRAQESGTQLQTAPSRGVEARVHTGASRVGALRSSPPGTVGSSFVLRPMTTRFHPTVLCGFLQLAAIESAAGSLAGRHGEWPTDVVLAARGRRAAHALCSKRDSASDSTRRVDDIGGSDRRSFCPQMPSQSTVLPGALHQQADTRPSPICQRGDRDNRPPEDFFPP